MFIPAEVTVSTQDVAMSNAAITSLILASIGVIVLLSLLVWVLFIIAYWKMFTKAGEAGWKSIIPIYNIYVAFRLCWKDGTKNFLIYILTAVVTCLCSSTVTVNDTTSSAAGNPVLGVIAFAAMIVCLIWYIRFCMKMAAAYSQGTGCAILSIFFPNIMTLYYGFASSAVYRGPQD